MNVRELKVDLAVCTYGRGDSVLSTVRKSLPELSVFNRVLVIDNNPNGLPEAIFEALRSLGVSVIHEPGVGLSRARNRALKESQADLVWFIDDDASLCADFASHASRHLKSFLGLPPDARPAFGGGLILAASSDDSHGDIGAFELGLLSCMKPEDPFAQPWGANMFLDRAVALEAGGFDPCLGWVKETGALLGEEDDLILRMSAHVSPDQRRAYFADGCSVHHWIPSSRRKVPWLLKRAFKGGRSNFIVYKSVPSTEVRSGLKNLLRAPCKDNLLRTCFIAGKLFERARSLLKRRGRHS